MKEEITTRYKIRTEIECNIVCEPTTEYRRTIVYHGVTITKALQDYYTFSTNREKVDVLKWIVAQHDFTELQRLSTAENKIYSLYTNQYDEILKTGEMPNNLQIAQKFVENGYDVFLLSNPKATKSADFIIRKRNCLYYVEGKTSSGGSALTVRLSYGAKQSERIAINLTNIPKIKRLAEIIKNTFIENDNLRELFIFKGSTLIEIDRFLINSKDFQTKIFKEFSRKK